jgi:CubicO group peptidase (beta-lactamase class C family)
MKWIGRSLRRSPASVLALALAFALAPAGCAGDAGDASQRQAHGVGAAFDVDAATDSIVRTAGMDSALLAAAVREAAALPRLRTLLVSRHGEMQLERHFRGPGLNSPANVKSVSKSILSAVVGIAIEDGHLAGVDQPIAPFFEQYLAPHDDAKRRITIGHLLSMQSGLEQTSGRLYGQWVSSPNWVRYAVTRPMIAEPGEARMYSTGNSHLAAALLTQATGQSLWAYTRERLAEPLGMTLPRWPADPQGIYFGGNEMRLTPRDLVRFGELYRNGGRHDGRQVIPERWVRESLTPRARARRTSEGYGYGWFLSQAGGHAMFYAWGYGGQFIFVVPALDLTVVTTSDPDAAREGEHLREVRRILRDLIVPAAAAGNAGSGTADIALRG